LLLLKIFFCYINYYDKQRPIRHCTGQQQDKWQKPLNQEDTAMSTKVSHLQRRGKIGSVQVTAVWFSQKRLLGVDSALGKQGQTKGRYIQLLNPVEARTIKTRRGEKILWEDFRTIQAHAKRDVRFQVARRAGEAVLSKNYSDLKQALELLAVTGQVIRDVDFKTSLKNISTKEKKAAVFEALDI